jgi:hypothetical protein
MLALGIAELLFRAEGSPLQHSLFAFYKTSAWNKVDSNFRSAVNKMIGVTTQPTEPDGGFARGYDN